MKLRAVSVVAAALAIAPTASGALVLRMAIAPSHPRVGQALTLRIRTYLPVTDPGRRCGFRLVARRVSYPFNVEAVGPDRRLHRLAVRQAKGNLYTGRLVPRVAGIWTIRITNFGTANPRCNGSRIRFRVSR
jgi:hypothetical protein